MHSAHSSPAQPASRPRLRSWREAQIARLLDSCRIAYLHEHPIAVVDDGKTRIWYPDFQLCNYGMLIEYCGLPDDPSYAAGMRRKQHVYASNGLNAVLVTPDRLKGDWPGRLLRTIDDALATRLATFRGAIATVTVAGYPIPDAATSQRRAGQ